MTILCACGDKATLYSDYSLEYYCSYNCMRVSLESSLDEGSSEYSYLEHCGVLDCKEI